MTILDPSLRDALRTLKLTGMLETLDARLAQTRAGTLGHLEFLQVLCEDEIARRETAALARRVRRARFEEQVTLEEFDFTANPKVPAAADPRPRRPALARRRRVGHPLRTRRGRQDPRRPGPRPPRRPPRRPRSASPRPAGSWPTSPAATPTAPGAPGPRATPDPPS